MKTTMVLVIAQLGLLLMIYLFGAQQPWLVLSAISLTAIVTYILLNRANKQQRQLFLALEHGLQSLRDNDFSVGINDDVASQSHRQLIDAFNQTSEKLRDERQHIYQREMLLDKVLNASPMVMVLVDQRGKIVLTNHAAQQTFNLTGAMIGRDWAQLVNALAIEFQNALASQGESIFSLIDQQGQQQAWHVACSTLTIHQATHHLYLLKTITQELSKQEVTTWKKVISVISHELNNSMAPISSMCHSGELLAKNLNEPRLNRVVSTISGRVNHLNEFIKGYASLTRVKEPKKSLISWPILIEQLQTLYQFELLSPLPTASVYADVAQIEQVLINILKNGHEADPQGNITLSFAAHPDYLGLEICDNGSGMSAEVIQNALLPFYSTKHSGTGVGLALCREIIDGHQGKLIFNNRSAGGLSVSVLLPY